MGFYEEELRKLVGKIPLLGVGAGVLILDDKRMVLLQHRSDCDAWGICGGVELGESVEEAARREVFEETNLEIGEMKLFNVFNVT